MKQLRFSTYGPPAILTLEEVPEPAPGPGEALVRVVATAINPSDVKNVAGHFKSPLPRVPGRDYAGVVVAGDAERGLEVWGSGAGFGVTRDGCHCGSIVVPSGWLVPKPRELSMEQAATVGVPYLTAWTALVREGRLQAGETVLVVGVSGAVGRAATQIAHGRQARVIGAATRPDNPAGADVLIDTSARELEREVRAATGGRGVDLVLDAVGGAMFEPALKTLARGGRHLAITSTGERRVSFDLIDFYHNTAHLIGVDTMKLEGPEIAALMNALRAEFEDGHLQAPEVTTWPLDRAVAAYEAVARGGARTRHVLRPDGRVR